VKKSPDPTRLQSLADLPLFFVPRACDVTMAAAEAKAQYSAIVLGATGNVGGRIVQLLIRNPRCKKVVVVTRRKTDVASAQVVPKTRRPSRPTLGSKLRRLTAKSQRASSKKLRGRANDD
jgi:NADPH:quinone reductase-like Zn-dependent oxidoreductase